MCNSGYTDIKYLHESSLVITPPITGPIAVDDSANDVKIL